MEGCTENRKRVRSEFDDSLVDSAESKLRRVNFSELRLDKPCTTGNWHVNSSKSERVGSGVDDAIIDLAESEEIQDELLNILDDSDAVAERDETIQGLELDSFIRSFEEEIQALTPVVQPSSKMTSDRNESASQPELGYLYEASDDELGLPPTSVSNTEGKIEAVDFMPPSPGVFELEGNLGFEDEIPCYDSFEIGIGIDSGEMSTAEENWLGGEFVALGGLFDYSDVPFRPESLSAL